MTNEEYKTVFWSRDLPTKFETWQKIAKGLVDALKAKNVDLFYVNQAEHFRSTLTLLPAASALSVYAEVVLKEVAQIDGWSKAEATPDDVKEICRQFNATVKAYAPSTVLNNLRDRIRYLKEDVSRIEDQYDSLENEIDDVKDELNETGEKLEKFANKEETDE